EKGMAYPCFCSEETLAGLGQCLSNVLEKNFKLNKKEEQHAIIAESEFICVSPSMKSLLKDIDMVADTGISIFVSGESGTGKELIAKRIHEKSGRTGRMVSLNMAGLSEELAANELFGHEKGSYTGAQTTKGGLIAQAENGTLFLDEITESSLRIQGMLLRVLESRQYYRIGGTQPFKANFRLITASNRSIKKAVLNGTFRMDLFYRINGIPISIPPLRERPEDIISLAYYYLRYFSAKYNRKSVSKLSESSIKSLSTHTWPGNVRELRNTMERSVLLNGGKEISFDDSGLEEKNVLNSYSEEKIAKQKVPETLPPSLFIDYPSLASLEQRYIEMIMQLTGEKVSDALKILKMSRSTLYAKLKAFQRIP
ncbi:MAG: sigma 54-interacting transcriptional regulator, partial [Mailhella sp.]